MAGTDKNYYLILGIARSANADEIKHAYRKLAMIHHPDKNPDSLTSEEFFKEIQEAYQVLSDAEKRIKYDQAKSWNFSFSYFQQVRHYFIVSADASEVKLNEEFNITYTYTGEGRFFQKPDMNDFFITGKPIVHFKMVNIDGFEIKETSLTYTIAPVKAGEITLARASIKINNEVYQTNQVKITVLPTICFFKKGEMAGNKPFRYNMHTRIEAGTLSHKVNYYQNHTVLIPRSEIARYYHNIGSIMKIGFSTWGFFLFSVSNLNEFLGIIAGSLFGGICCHILYFITGIKSKFYFTNKFNVVQLYKAKGYEKGKYSGSEFLTGKFISWVGDIMG